MLNASNRRDRPGQVQKYLAIHSRKTEPFLTFIFRRLLDSRLLFDCEMERAADGCGQPYSDLIETYKSAIGTYARMVGATDQADKLALRSCTMLATEISFPWPGTSRTFACSVSVLRPVSSSKHRASRVSNGQ